MNRYIDVNELQENICKRVSNSAIRGWLNAIINDISAADVAPVMHGHWIKYAKYSFGTMYDCSICNDRILDNGHSWHYCPNCGAKMDEERKDEK